MTTEPTEADWRKLTNTREVNKRRKEAEKNLHDLSNAQLDSLRRRMKHDLFFLATAGLGYTRLSKTFHGAYCNWLKAVRGERYRLTLFARDHYKTTINTVSDSIQMTLPGGEDLPHPYNLGPNIKILLAHEIQESAAKFLFEITKAYTAKPLMLALYPELIPNNRRQRMNKYELELPREEHHREATFSTIGAGGAAQGQHFNWLKLDDLVGEDARDSETVMGRILQWFDNVNALLTRLKYDGWDLTGTRWAHKDVYSHAVERYGVKKDLSILNAYDPRDIEGMEPGNLVIYARGAVENGVPVFSEEFSMEDLNVLRKNPLVWAAQFANNPRESGMTQLDPRWLKFYHVGNGDRLIVWEGEGADKTSRITRTSELDRIIMIDPSVGESRESDESGIVVTGTDQRMNIYVLEAFRKRLKPPELIDEMFRLHTKWNPRLISIESVAFSAMLKYWFEQKCQEMGVYPSIYDYKPGSKRSKHARIQSLTNYAAGGQLYILEGMHQLRDEWEWFPMSDIDHILDALAQGPEVWSPALVRRAEEAEKAVDFVMENRDVLTGY